jgi:hypothetical protein
MVLMLDWLIGAMQGGVTARDSGYADPISIWRSRPKIWQPLPKQEQI